MPVTKQEYPILEYDTETVWVIKPNRNERAQLPYNCLTTVYFIRHAESDHTVRDDLNRPLTDKGMRDCLLVTDYLKDKGIRKVISSPFRRAVDTVADFAERYGFEVKTVQDFRERQCGSDWLCEADFWPFIKRQWHDFAYKLSDGECLREVQERNITALDHILEQYEGQNIVIGTHGTALSTIINYYDNTYGFKDFLAMVHLMPWIVKMGFTGRSCISIEKINIL